ncbi:MAG: hypothetical protein ACUVTP_07335 [Candidatus Fervidibacter sp.]|uniref:hypothetical protein n=1 Tax=Candidatus Fervidibacter sp. TaxID=3100871 RepID=UPI00404B4BDB
MGAEKSRLEAELENLRHQLTEAGVKILSGNWGGKGGVARYKGQWFVVMDRHLPPTLKLRLLQKMCQYLSVSDQSADGAKGDPDGGTPASDPN